MNRLYTINDFTFKLSDLICISEKDALKLNITFSFGEWIFYFDSSHDRGIAHNKLKDTWEAYIQHCLNSNPELLQK